MEFVGSHGLGVVFLGQVPDGLLQKFYESSPSGGMPSIQGAFGSISDDIIQTSRNEIIVSAVAERSIIVNSTIWQLFSPYRKTLTLLGRS